MKLREHKEQEFLDSDDLYAWIFQVTSPYNYLVGIAMSKMSNSRWTLFISKCCTDITEP